MKKTRRRYDRDFKISVLAETDAGERYMIIQDPQSNDLALPISRSCQALKVSRSGYYEWLKPFEDISSENSEYLGFRRSLPNSLVTDTGGSLQNLGIEVMLSTISAC